MNNLIPSIQSAIESAADFDWDDAERAAIQIKYEALLRIKDLAINLVEEITQEEVFSVNALDTALRNYEDITS